MAAATALQLKNLSKLRLGRETLERWVTQPELDQIIEGCFVRILVGEKKGVRLYRICHVKGLETGETPYKFGDVETNKYLLLEYGSVCKSFKMDYVSNSEFTQAEFDEWVQQMIRSNKPILTPKEVDKKVKKIRQSVEQKQAKDEEEMRKEEEKKRLKAVNLPVVVPTGINEEPLIPIRQGEDDDEDLSPIRPSRDTMDVDMVQVKREREVDSKPIENAEDIKKRRLTNPPEKIELISPDLVKPAFEVVKAQAQAEGSELLLPLDIDMPYDEYFRYCTAMSEESVSQAKTILQLEAEHRNKQSELIEIRKQLQRLESGDDSELRRKIKEQEMSDLERKLAELQKSFDEQRKEQRDEIKNKDTHINELKIKLRDLRRDHESVYRDIDKERKDSKALCQRKDREIHSLQLRMKEITSKLAQHNVKLAEQQQVIDIQDELIDELQQQLKEEEEQQIQLQKKRRQQAKILGEKGKSVTTLSEELTELTAKYDALKSDPELLQAARLAGQVIE